MASPNVLLMLKTFEVDSKWRNIERHPKYSKIYTRNVLESFEVGSKDVQSIRTTYTCRSICNSLPKYGAIFLISSFRLVLLKGEVQTKINIILKERVKISLQIGAKIMKIG